MYDKVTALYCRYSRDDGQETENASITHQKALLKEYAENNGYPNLRYYVDDGYTGTNFNRPDFQRMMEDVENGIIETIVVKDMSRFGRNYILEGQYVELVLPQHHVRVIGVTDHYDSYNTENDLFVFKSIFAEIYAADISKKITYAKHTLGMNGVKLKSHPLYGYKLVDGDHNRWEIDEESAKIVRMIFDMFLHQDMSINSIAKYLRTNKVLTPSAYMGYKYTKVGTSYGWLFQTVRRLLEFQEYCGDTVNFKTKTTSYKSKSRLFLPKENWVVFENQHPAIISREDFEKTQEKLKTISKNSFSPSNEMKNDTFFRNKCVCAKCGAKMHRRHSVNGVYFVCKTYVQYGTCRSNHITENELRRITLDHLKKLYMAVKNGRDTLITQLGLNQLTELDKQIKEAENRVNAISRLLTELYEKKFQGKLSDSEFRIQSRALSSEAVTQEICDALIEKIVIDEPMGQKEKNYGKRIVDIYIYELGNLSELVDVRFKPYSQRIKEIAPQLLLERRCDTTNVIEALATKRTSLKSALAEEETNFQTVIVEVRKEILIDAIKKGLSMKEIYPLLGYPESSNVYWFAKRFLSMSFNDFYRKTRKEI